MDEFPKIISVDDHVVEPPNVWQDRLPEKYKEVGPRVVRRPLGELTFVGGKLTVKVGEPGTGPDVDWWFYEELRRPLMRLDAAAGYPRDEVDLRSVTYDDMRKGAWSVPERLEDMDTNWLESSLCFPTFPRFCGQTFTEAKDRDLGLLCVKAYNDWMVEEWCGPSDGRLIPLIIVPLWDANLAAEEVRRNAARGVRAVCFSEIPPNLGLPSIHDKDGFWEPFFQACAETGTVINMHIGSGSKMPSTSADAPPAVGSTLTFANACFSMVDWLMSGVFERHTDLKIAYSEGQIGWIPYVLERADIVWEENRGWGGVADKVHRPPSELFREHIYGCFFSDAFGLENLEAIGEDNVTYESDYPHSDSTWPNTRSVAEEQMKKLSREQIEKITRKNAITMLHLSPEGRHVLTS
ncbi:MAG TPA: amidohydrolase family protein [Mycobacteriales bacterium]|nr:amidohydrolase family protein [Mycobacteriales bacterium]